MRTQVSAAGFERCVIFPCLSHSPLGFGAAWTARTALCRTWTSSGRTSSRALARTGRRRRPHRPATPSGRKTKFLCPSMRCSAAPWTRLDWHPSCTRECGGATRGNVKGCEASTRVSKNCGACCRASTFLKSLVKGD